MSNNLLQNELTGLVVRDLETKATMTNLQSNQKEVRFILTAHFATWLTVHIG